MSEITFLDIAKQVRINWWRYIITIGLSAGVSFIVTLVLFIMFVYYT